MIKRVKTIGDENKVTVTGSEVGMQVMKGVELLVPTVGVVNTGQSDQL